MCEFLQPCFVQLNQKVVKVIRDRLFIFHKCFDAGCHERMTFHKQPESLGFSFICLATYSFSASLNSCFTWCFNDLYNDQALELFVLPASLHYLSLVCISAFISSVTKGFGLALNLTHLIGACSSRIGLKSK